MATESSHSYTFLPNANQTQNAAMVVKEGAESALFSFFSTARNFIWFTTHMLRFILFPVIGASFLINAIIDNYKLYRAKNKNADTLFNAIASSLVALLAVSSITGTILGAAGILATEFTLGPFLFLGALGVAFTHQLGMGIVNLVRFLNAPLGSAERQAHKQAIFRNLFQMALFTIVALTVTSAMISPLGPTVMFALAIAASSLTGVNLIWRIIPDTWKNTLKSVLGFAKPEISLSPKMESSIQAQTPDDKTRMLPLSETHKGLFTASYRNHKVKQIINKEGTESAKRFLLSEITQKSSLLGAKTQQDTKTTSKLAVLDHLKRALEGTETLEDNIATLAKKHQHAFQSFFSKVSDTEDLYLAVKTLVNAKTSHTASSTPSMNK